MGFFQSLLGRSKPVRPDLERLFALPSAAVTLQAGEGYAATGAGSVCFSAAEGGAFARVQQEVRQLLDADVPRHGAGQGDRAAGPGGTPVEFTEDEYGYTWVLVRRDPSDLAGLVNDLHAVNTLLQESGFGPQLLCSLVGFRPDGERPDSGTGGPLALVYLYKQGTFYPFAPLPGENRRDNPLELRVRGLLAGDLPLEQDLARWFPVWGAPGL